MEVPQIYTGSFAFFRRHLNGDYSLGQSYWVNTLMISMFAPLLGILMLPWLGKNFPARYSSAGVLLVTALGIAAWAWAISGTWASANKHVARGGKQGWASIAKLMIVLSVLRMLGDFEMMTGSLGEHLKVALGWQLGPEVSLQIRADGKSLLVKGGINDGTAEALSKALDIAPSVTTVVLYSTGGWVRQGNMIAKVISDRRLNTYIEEECTSACTIAFLAGKERSADPNARIGFHSFKSIGASDKLGEPSDIESARNTYKQAGLSPSFIAKIVSTSNEKVWYPSHEELLAEGVLTRQSFGGETATVATTASTREKLVVEFKKTPAINALSLKYPNEFEQLIDKAWTKVKARKSDGEVMAAGREQISQLMGKLLPIASDASLIDFNRLILDKAEALSRKSATACVELIFPTGKLMNIAAILPPDLAARERVFMNDLILGSDIRNAKKFSKKESERVVIKILGSLASDQVQMFVSEEKRAASPVAACTAAVAYLRKLNAIPMRDRARSLRAIYTGN